MFKLESFMLNIRSLPLGKSEARYDSREFTASFEKAKATLTGMADLRIESVAFEVDIDKDDREWVRLNGIQHVDLSNVCSRCAERFLFSFSKRIGMTFIPAIDAMEIPAQDEGDTLSSYEEDLIDLFPVLMESVFLEVPIKPLCHEGCVGLCPQCGTNLNLRSCTCPQKAEDVNLGKMIAQAASLDHH